MQTPENTVAYTYDSLNRRLTANDQHFLYHGQNEIGAYVDNELTELRLLGLGKGAEIGAAVAIFLNDELYTPIHDHNGNLACTLNNNHPTPIRYTAFGEEETPPSLQPWRFASKRTDPETHLIYFGHRYYDPSLGRWITPDPIGYQDGPNLYAFLQNDPLISVDLYGLERDREPPSFTNHSSQDRRTTVNYVSSGHQRSESQTRSEFRAQLNAQNARNRLINENLRSACAFNKDWGPHNPSYEHYDLESKNDSYSRHIASCVQDLWNGFSDPIEGMRSLEANPRSEGGILSYINARNVSISVGVLLAITPVGRGFKTVKTALSIIARTARVPSKPSTSSNLNEGLISIGNFKYSRSSAHHFMEVASKGPNAGRLSRPFMRSPHLIKEIMAAKKPIPDPKGVPNTSYWAVPGTFRGKDGNWELLLHPESGIIYHFNFR